MNRAELIKNLHYKLDSVPSLSPKLSADIDRVMRHYTDTLLSIEIGKESGAAVDDIDFPDFVSDLIQGTFEAIVDASIQQMDAYTELLENVTGSIDQFQANAIGDNYAEDYLTEEFKFDAIGASERNSDDLYKDCEKLRALLARMGIKLAIECPPSDKQLGTIREALAVRSRQKLLTTLVMTGINRIVVSDENRITEK